jgi:hypothetical protein
MTPFELPNESSVSQKCKVYHLRWIDLKSLALRPDAGLVFDFVLTLTHCQVGAFDGSLLVGPRTELRTLGDGSVHSSRVQSSRYHPTLWLYNGRRHER